MASWAHEPDCSIRCLEIIHVMGVPSHLWFYGKMENYFSLVCDSREVRHVCINDIHAIVHVHGMNIEGGQNAHGIAA